MAVDCRLRRWVGLVGWFGLITSTRPPPPRSPSITLTRVTSVPPRPVATKSLYGGLRPSGSRCRACLVNWVFCVHTPSQPFFRTESFIRGSEKRDRGWSGRTKCQSQDSSHRDWRAVRGRRARPDPSSPTRPHLQAARPVNPPVAFFRDPCEPRRPGVLHQRGG